jgi:hypothetical protein
VLFFTLQAGVAAFALARMIAFGRVRVALQGWSPDHRPPARCRAAAGASRCNRPGRVPRTGRNRCIRRSDGVHQFAAPTMASIGQAWMHLVQPMHSASRM